MKIAGITLERPPRAGLVHLAGCWAAGFLAAACCLEGRAPLAAGLMAASRIMTMIPVSVRTVLFLSLAICWCFISSPPVVPVPHPCIPAPDEPRSVSHHTPVNC